MYILLEFRMTVGGGLTTKKYNVDNLTLQSLWRILFRSRRSGLLAIVTFLKGS